MYLILTNNPLVREKMGKGHRILYRDTSIEEIFGEALNLVCEGHKLLSHPLSGSVKPVEMPYKSILLEEKKKECDQEGIRLLMNARDACGKFRDVRAYYDERLLRDFREIDYSLIRSAVDSADVINF